jgi:hypothetical protein
VVAITPNRVYVRLAANRGRWGSTAKESEVVVFEVPEIISISMRTVEVLSSGWRKAKQWLVIEPAEAPPEEVSDRLRSLSCGASRCDPDKEVLVADEGGRFTIEWRLYRPALRVFMDQAARKCPSLVVAPEQRRKLDLKGAWREPWPCQRQILAEAKRLGFGAACALDLMRFRHISFSQATAYMVDLSATPLGKEIPPASGPAVHDHDVSAAIRSSRWQDQTLRSGGEEPHWRETSSAHRDLCLRGMISLAMGLVLAVDFTFWGFELKDRILVEAAGSLWLAVLWLPATRRPVGLRQMVSLIIFAASAVIVWKRLGAVIVADFWFVVVLVTGIGELLFARAPGTTYWRPLKVTASGLCGAIEHGSTYASATLVQEFSTGWESELSSVMTDRSGRFALPQAAPGPVHYLAISHPGTETQYLVVTLAEDAKPLLVRLRPWSG